MTNENISTILFILNPKSNEDVFAKLDKYFSQVDKQNILNELFKNDVPNFITEKCFLNTFLLWLKENKPEFLSKLVNKYEK